LPQGNEENISSTEAKRDGTLLSIAAHICLEDDLDQAKEELRNL